ncbi:MAG: hemin receptor [Chloroflexi bacterium]|nr:hemin receptor [Chloroflexota bacterium]
MSLTDKQRQLVSASFAQLVPVTKEATSVFYNHLWSIAPETKTMFHLEDIEQQGIKLMQTLGIAVRAIHDLNTIGPFLYDLGQRHITYGVSKDQYNLVKSALLTMIEHCLGGDFTPEVREAWDVTYNIITDLTLTAYD